MHSLALPTCVKIIYGYLRLDMKTNFGGHNFKLNEPRGLIGNRELKYGSSENYLIVENVLLCFTLTCEGKHKR